MGRCVDLCLISMRQSWLKFTLACLLVLVTKGLIIVCPILIGRILDAFTTGQIGKVPLLALIYLGCGISASGLLPVMRFISSTVLQQTICYLSHLWTDQILGKDLSFFNKDRIGSRVQIIDRGIFASEKLLHFALVSFLPSALELILVAGYLMLSGGVLLLGVLTGFALLAMVVLDQMIGWRREFVRRLCREEDRQGELILELFQAAKTLRVCGAEVSGLLNDNLKDYAAGATDQSYVKAKITAFEQLTLHLGGALIIVFGWVTVQNSEITAGEFLVWFVLSQRFLSCLLSLAHQWKEIDRAQTELEPLDKLLGAPHSRTEKKIDLPTAHSYHLRLMPCQLELPGSSQNIEIVSPIEIPSGCRLAIVGGSGQGKTYLAEAISGVHHHLPKNKWFMGNRDLCGLSQDQIAKIVYLAESHPSFIHGSFWHAILLGKYGGLSHLSPDQLHKMLSSLGLAKFQDGAGDESFLALQTCSAGEKKRLGLLRAFCLQKPITILDEPTESLDSDLAQKIWPVIFDQLKGRTVICITHDISYLEHFDMVCELADHKLQLRSHSS